MYSCNKIWPQILVCAHEKEESCLNLIFHILFSFAPIASIKFVKFDAKPSTKEVQNQTQWCMLNGVERRANNKKKRYKCTKSELLRKPRAAARRITDLAKMILRKLQSPSNINYIASTPVPFFCLTPRCRKVLVLCIKTLTFARE